MNKGVFAAVCGMVLVLAVSGVAVFAAEEAAPPPGTVKLTPELPPPGPMGTPSGYISKAFDWKDQEPLFVPEGAALLSVGRPVTSGDNKTRPDALKKITDAKKSWEESYVVTLSPGLQWVQVDLGEEQKIDAVAVWHAYEREKAYHDIIVKISNEPEFKEATVLYNNDFDLSAEMGEGQDKEYFENRFGRIIDGKGTAARYVRLYSQGNSEDDANHYIEVEVWGRPAN